MRFFVNVYMRGDQWVSYFHETEDSAKGAEKFGSPADATIEVQAKIGKHIRGERVYLLDNRSPDEIRTQYGVLPIAENIQAAFKPLDFTHELPIRYTLPTDSNARKDVQLLAAFLNYIPAAARKFAEHSKFGNDKHNPGQPIHHARWKSTDQEECILRHLMDIQDLNAHIKRGDAPRDAVITALITEATAMFWRSGIFLQQICEQYDGAPRAPGARLEGETP